MKEVKYFVHSNSPHIFPRYMMMNQLAVELAEMQKLARDAMQKSGASHSVYAVKRYAESGDIDRVDLYNPPVCLNDKDFYERTEAEAKEHPGCLIYAVHAL